MNTKQLGPYAKAIRKLLGCPSSEAVMIEDIMRNDVLHTVALDWLSAQEFKLAVGKAALVLSENRVDYELYYAGTRAVFDQMKVAQLKTA
ncbi:MAG: hypothetical protein ACR2OZ_15320 [Verrucomicrobiales bacterium]